MKKNDGRKKIALLVENGDSTVLAVEGNEGLEVLASLAENGHRFRVSKYEARGRGGRSTDIFFAVQGEARLTTAMSDARIQAGRWDRSNIIEHDRHLVAGAGACDRCDDLLSCGGQGRSIPDLIAKSKRQWGQQQETAADELNDAVRRSMWDTCLMTTGSQDVSERTIKPEHVHALGLKTAKSVGEVADPSASGDLLLSIRKMIDAGVDISRIPAAEIESRIPDILRGWNTNPTAFGKVPFIDSYVFDEDLYQINVSRQRCRASRSGATRSANVEFRRQNCSRCAYNCDSPPRSRPSSCAVTIADTVAGVEISDDDKVFMFGHTLSGKKSDQWRLTNTRRPRKGIVYGSDSGMLRIVSLVTPYRVIGSVSMNTQSSMSAAEWFKGFAERNSGVDMKHVLWGLRSVRRIVDAQRRKIEWHGGGRAMKNTVLSIRLDDSGNIDVLTDTLAHSWRGSGASISSDDRPRYSFKLEYPYFRDFRVQMQEFPGSARGRW